MIFKPASKGYSLMKLFNLFMSLTLCSVYSKENREFPILPSTKKKKKKMENITPSSQGVVFISLINYTILNRLLGNITKNKLYII
jgi:hypothetical protein